MEQLQRDESPPESGRERVKHRRERRASPSISTFAPGGGAQRALPGLQVQCRLRIGSPDRCAASPPGNSPTLRAAPGAARNAPCPGYRFSAVCGPVARTDAQHRLRETLPLRARLPGAARNAPCPGYGFSAVCGPVARTDAQHRLRDRSLTPAASPPASSTAPRRAESVHR